MISSQYTVTTSSIEPGQRINDEDKKSTYSDISELPTVLQIGLRYSANRHPMAFIFISLLSGGYGSFQLFLFVTGSLAVAIPIAAVFSSGAVAYITLADFSEGVFLELLLSDRDKTEKMAQNAKGNIYGSLFMQVFVFFPLLTYFVAVPFAHTDFLGAHTYTVSIIMHCLSMLSTIVSILYDIQPLLTAEISHAWEAKIKTYMQKIQNILIETNNMEEDALTAAEAGSFSVNRASGVTNRIALEQEKVEKWALQITKGTTSYNTLSISFSFAFLCIILGILGAGIDGEKRLASIIILSLFIIFILLFLLHTLHSVAKPNILWEKSKTHLLNDARVRRAIVRTGWSEQWDDWLHHHELNSSRAFGIKVTTVVMRRASSAMLSIFAPALYFLLREEINNFA